VEGDKLLDHFIRSHQHVWRNRQADLLSGFQIDDELKLYWLLDRKIGGLRAFQDLVYVGSGAPVQVGSAHAVAHKPALFHSFRPVVYRWQPTLYREVRNLWSLRSGDETR
jgi:hypothetical protein